jgi:hypothetical protein
MGRFIHRSSEFEKTITSVHTPVLKCPFDPSSTVICVSTRRIIYARWCRARRPLDDPHAFYKAFEIPVYSGGGADILVDSFLLIQ